MCKKNDGINAVICGQGPNLFYVIIILNCYFGANKPLKTIYKNNDKKKTMIKMNKNILLAN